MVLLLRAGEGAALRLGVVSSRASVGNAVARNRARRRLRSAFRLNRSQFSGAHDVVLIARRPLLAAPWADITSELLYLARKSGLLKAAGVPSPVSPRPRRATEGGGQGAAP
jgi:ribonuclease P protein component